MSSAAEQPTLVLIRRQADGTIEWVPLETPLQRVPVTPEAAYALIDRTHYEAPQTLVAQRVGEDLVVAVEGTEVLVLDKFFVTVDVAFYPTTDIVGGAGPFSGTPLTPDSPMPAPLGDQVVGSAEDGDREPEEPSDGEEPDAGGEVGSSTSPLLWVGVAAGGLGLAALAGGGGGSGGGSGGGAPSPGPGPTQDSVPPQITSGATAPGIAENSGSGQVVYSTTATDAGAVTYTLKAGGGDEAAFSINGGTGAVTLTGNPDFETKSSYSFTVVATDAANNTSEQAVSLAIIDVNDTATPITITSGATASAVAENSGAGQVVYTVTATATGAVTYSLKTDADADLFSINASTGAVTLTGSPDHETRSSYNFTVIATAGANSAEQAVSLAINDLDEAAPSITSGATATAIDENSGSNQVVYTVTSTDTGDISTGATAYSLKAGGDLPPSSINANTGAVRLPGNPDHETKSSYHFTVVASDAAGNRSERAVSLTINDRDDTAPTITSEATATAIDENSGSNQVVYTVTSTDTADVSTGTTTYSLKAGGDLPPSSINASTGAVRLPGNPDHETKSSYNFTVVATDAAGNRSERAVSLTINDRDEVAPSITSDATAPDIVETSGTGQVIYTVTSTDTGDISTGSTRYSLAGGDADFFTIDDDTGDVTLTGNPDFETKPSYHFTVVATDAAGNSSERAVSLAILDIDDSGPPGDLIAPTLSSSTPADEAEDVPVEADIVLTFSENMRIGSGDIILISGNDTRFIDVTDGSQVSISGNQVTIDPTADLEEDRRYRVHIDRGALGDEAGNAFAGLSGNALDFETEQEDDDDDLQALSIDQGSRTFESDPSHEIDIRVDSNDATLGPAGSDLGTWGGSADLGSDDRVALVGNGADAHGPSASVAPLSVSADAVAWQSSAESDAGSFQVESNTTVLDASLPATFPGGLGGQTNTIDFANMPAGTLTSQGLV